MKDEMYNKVAIICPCCGEKYSVKITSHITEIIVNDVSVTTWQPSSESQEILDHAKRDGIFDAFVKVLRQSRIGSLPKNEERFFINYIKGASSTFIPKFAMNYFASIFNGTITYLTYQQIGTILVNGEIAGFIPNELVLGNKKQKIGATPGEFTEYMKTRFGLVYGKGAYWAMMQQKAIGGFASVSHKYTT